MHHWRRSPILSSTLLQLTSLSCTRIHSLHTFSTLLHSLPASQGLEVPRKADHEFEESIAKAITSRNLQPEDSFILKVVQLEELLEVRHSVFVLGAAATGKSCVLRALFDVYRLQGQKPVWVDLNPKACTNHELYGYINMATREWVDGLFSSLMRDMANITNDYNKWLVMDGDIDTMWIESLNTVMDDNKILTLASNERIPLNPTMRMLFEIANLTYASPATVSRAGILFINPTDLGWQPCVQSWIDQLESPNQRANLMMLFEKCALYLIFTPNCFGSLFRSMFANVCGCTLHRMSTQTAWSNDLKTFSQYCSCV